MGKQRKISERWVCLMWCACEIWPHPDSTGAVAAQPDVHGLEIDVTKQRRRAEPIMPKSPSRQNLQER